MTSFRYDFSLGFIESAGLAAAAEGHVEWSEKNPRHRDERRGPDTELSQKWLCASSYSKVSYTHRHVNAHSHTLSHTHFTLTPPTNQFFVGTF